MDNITDLIKQHPVATVGIVVIGAVLMSTLFGSSSAAPVDTGVAASLQSQQIATQGNVAMAQVNADVSKTQLAANTAVAQSQIAASASNYTSVLGLVSNLGVNKMNNLTQQNMQASAQSSQDKATLLSYLLNKQSLDNTNQVQNAQIIASQNVALQNLSYGLQTVKDNNNTALSALASKLGFQTHVVDTNASSLPMLLQHDLNSQEISANNAQSLANINATSALSIASMNAATSRNNTIASGITSALNGGGVTSLISSVAGMFGGGSGATANTSTNNNNSGGGFNIADLAPLALLAF